MKKIYYLFILSFIIVACKRDCTQTTKEPETIDKNVIAHILVYKGNEKLRFLKNGIDTVFFYGQGTRTEFQYTSAQEETCPDKIPLENKYLVFLDSINRDNFLIQLNLNSEFSNCCLFKINDKILYNGDFSIITKPYQSIDVLGTKYDSISYKEKQNNYLYYKTNSVGMLKFKTENDIFELIP